MSCLSNSFERPSRALFSSSEVWEEVQEPCIPPFFLLEYGGFREIRSQSSPGPMPPPCIQLFSFTWIKNSRKMLNLAVTPVTTGRKITALALVTRPAYTERLRVPREGHFSPGTQRRPVTHFNAGRENHSGDWGTEVVKCCLFCPSTYVFHSEWHW